MINTLRGIRVLLVEDDQDSQDTMRLMLEMEGASVACATSAADGLRALFAAAHELVEAEEFCALPLRVLLPSCFLIGARQHESQRRAVGRQLHAGFELHD